MISELIMVIVTCGMGWGIGIAYVLTMPKEQKYTSPWSTLPKGFVNTPSKESMEKKE